jgi:hypothetical protein
MEMEGEGKHDKVMAEREEKEKKFHSRFTFFKFYSDMKICTRKKVFVLKCFLSG